MIPLDLTGIPQEIYEFRRPWKPHTAVKLQILEHYLSAFLAACLSIPAQHDIYYIDCFAGVGLNRLRNAKKLVPGSPLIALASEHMGSSSSNFPGKVVRFTKYHFVEVDPRSMASLKRVVARLFPEVMGRVDFWEGDCNELIAEILRDVSPYSPCFVFLDQESTELDWSTVKQIAEKRSRDKPKPELLILLPVSMAWLRLLNMRGIGARARSRMARVMPTSDWEKVYERRRTDTIKPKQFRQELVRLYTEGLCALGYKYVLSRSIASSRGRPLYRLIHATNHEAGKKIMEHLFRSSHGEQLTWFSVFDSGSVR